MVMVTEQPRTGSGPIRIAYVIAAINTEHAGTEGHLLRLMRSLDRERFAPRLVVMQRSAWTEQFDDPDLPLHVLDFTSFQRPADWPVFPGSPRSSVSMIRKSPSCTSSMRISPERLPLAMQKFPLFFPAGGILVISMESKASC